MRSWLRKSSRPAQRSRLRRPCESIWQAPDCPMASLLHGAHRSRGSSRGWTDGIGVPPDAPAEIVLGCDRRDPRPALLWVLAAEHVHGKSRETKCGGGPLDGVCGYRRAGHAYGGPMTAESEGSEHVSRVASGGRVKSVARDRHGWRRRERCTSQRRARLSFLFGMQCLSVL